MQKVVAGVIGVTIVAVVIAAGLLLVQKPVAKEEPATNKQESKIMDTGSLQIKDNVVGTGAEAVDGKKVRVHYTGTLTDGTKFDSSVDRGTPFEFTLGAGQVIAGWDQGVKGMKVGGKRNLIIPASLGYGDRSVATIPPNSTLVFDVELLAVN